MPFKSDAQRAWMFKNKPEMAKKWEKETPKGKNLPKYVKKKALKDSLEHKLDLAFGLIEGQTSHGPTLGASQSVSKGSPSSKYTEKKPKKSKKLKLKL